MFVWITAVVKSFQSTNINELGTPAVVGLASEITQTFLQSRRQWQLWGDDVKRGRYF